MRRASLDAPAAVRQTHFACLRRGRARPCRQHIVRMVRSRGACLSTAPAHHHLTMLQCGGTPRRTGMITVETRVTSRPPHRAVRAQFGHTAPTLGV